MESQMNARQARFCELVASGENQTDPWIKAAYKVTRQVAAVNASKCLRNAKVAKYVEELRQKRISKSLLSRDEKRTLLAAIARDPSQKPLARIRAIETDAKIAGHFEPEHHVIDGGNKTLDDIKARALKVASALSCAGALAVRRVSQ